MKQVVAKRIKKKEPKGLFIFLIIIAIVSLALGIVCLINPMKEDSMQTLGIMLLTLTAIYIPIICVYPAAIKRIRKVNSYPEEAVVVDETTLYILTDKLVKIPLADIKSVRGQMEVSVGVLFRTFKTYGNLTIKTATEKYKLTQIAEIVKTTQVINSYIKK
ncbi:MAG: hypothetical protein IJY90_02385 [Clostridia bacterium]|nr:hypothetical protein [Clostridia bacterium]